MEKIPSLWEFKNDIAEGLLKVPLSYKKNLLLQQHDTKTEGKVKVLQILKDMTKFLIFLIAQLNHLRSASNLIPELSV